MKKYIFSVCITITFLSQHAVVASENQMDFQTQQQLGAVQEEHKKQLQDSDFISRLQQLPLGSMLYIYPPQQLWGVLKDKEEESRKCSTDFSLMDIKVKDRQSGQSFYFHVQGDEGEPCVKHQGKDYFLVRDDCEINRREKKACSTGPVYGVRAFIRMLKKNSDNPQTLKFSVSTCFVEKGACHITLSEERVES